MIAAPLGPLRSDVGSHSFYLSAKSSAYLLRWLVKTCVCVCVCVCDVRMHSCCFFLRRSKCICRGGEREEEEEQKQ